MSEFSSMITVKAPIEDVFAFVCDPANMPQYLPTVHHAETQGPERIRMDGEAAGHRYDSDGEFRIDDDTHRMEWNSDGENNYSGCMQLTGDETMCQVMVRIMFAPKPSQRAQFKGREESIQQGLNEALKAIKRICEAANVPGGGKAYAG